MRVDLKKLAGIVAALGILGGAVVWALKGTFPTKEQMAADIVIGIEVHNSKVDAHEKLLKLVIPMVVDEVEKRHGHDRRRSDLLDSEKVEVMVMGNGR